MDSMNHLYAPKGISVLTDKRLPIKETRKACSLDSREEINIPTGKLIHMFANKEQRVVFVSSYMKLILWYSYPQS
jgi:hypothetical protein